MNKTEGSPAPEHKEDDGKHHQPPQQQQQQHVEQPSALQQAVANDDVKQQQKQQPQVELLPPGLHALVSRKWSAVPLVAFDNSLLLSTNNEDLRCELKAVDHLHHLRQQQRKPRDDGEGGLRVLTVIGGADSTVALLCDPRVGRVDAVDKAEAQVHLLHLKVAAIRSGLSQTQLLRLVARDVQRHVDGAAAYRQYLYKQYVRQHLPDASRQFWDARAAHDIAYGFLDSGRFEQTLLRMRQRLEEYGVDPATLLTNSDRQTTLKVAADVLGKSYDVEDSMKILRFRGVLPDAVLEKMLPQFHKLFREQQDGFRRLLAHDDYTSNWYLWNQLTAYLPDWLHGDDPTGHWTSRRPRDLHHERLHTFTDDIDGHFARLAKDDSSSSGGDRVQYDLMTLSNIFDWAPDDKLVEPIRSIAKRLAPGGILLLRRAIGGLSKAMEEAGLQLVPELNQLFSHYDRNPFFHLNAAGHTVVAAMKPLE